MPFRLRRDTREWFSYIEGDLSLDFDMYYLCLMAGLATGRREELESEQKQTTELVDNYPGSFREKGRLINAYFLCRMLNKLGVDLSERDTVNDVIAEYVDPISPNQLSDIGQREINRYSYGGFEVLTEWFDDKPRHMETFLPLYKRYLDEVLSANST